MSAGYHSSRAVLTRPGAALLEALVALTIFSISALAAAHIAIDASRAVARISALDEELRGANAFMHAIALWSRSDLDRHLGTRSEGPFVLRVEHSDPVIYDVVLLRKELS